MHLRRKLTDQALSFVDCFTKDHWRSDDRSFDPKPLAKARF